jgi:hypothetical protein
MRCRNSYRARLVVCVETYWSHAMTQQPDHLEFLPVSQAVVAGKPILPLAVQIWDKGGTRSTSNDIEITLALTSGPRGAVLTGNTRRSSVYGVVTFDDVAVDRAGGGYQLTAIGPGVQSAVSAIFSVTADPATFLGADWVLIDGKNLRRVASIEEHLKGLVNRMVSRKVLGWVAGATAFLGLLGACGLWGVIKFLPDEYINHVDQTIKNKVEANVPREVGFFVVRTPEAGKALARAVVEPIGEVLEKNQDIRDKIVARVGSEIDSNTALKKQIEGLAATEIKKLENLPQRFRDIALDVKRDLDQRVLAIELMMMLCDDANQRAELQDVLLKIIESSDKSELRRISLRMLRPHQMDQSARSRRHAMRVLSQLKKERVLDAEIDKEFVACLASFEAAAIDAQLAYLDEAVQGGDLSFLPQISVICRALGRQEHADNIVMQLVKRTVPGPDGVTNVVPWLALAHIRPTSITADVRRRAASMAWVTGGRLPLTSIKAVDANTLELRDAATGQTAYCRVEDIIPRGCGPLFQGSEDSIKDSLNQMVLLGFAKLLALEDWEHHKPLWPSSDDWTSHEQLVRAWGYCLGCADACPSSQNELGSGSASVATAVIEKALMVPRALYKAGIVDAIRASLPTCNGQGLDLFLKTLPTKVREGGNEALPDNIVDALHEAIARDASSGFDRTRQLVKQCRPDRNFRLIRVLAPSLTQAAIAGDATILQFLYSCLDEPPFRGPNQDEAMRAVAVALRSIKPDLQDAATSHLLAVLAAIRQDELSKPKTTTVLMEDSVASRMALIDDVARTLSGFNLSATTLQSVRQVLIDMNKAAAGKPDGMGSTCGLIRVALAGVLGSQNDTKAIPYIFAEFELASNPRYWEAIDQALTRIALAVQGYTQRINPVIKAPDAGAIGSAADAKSLKARWKKYWDQHQERLANLSLPKVKPLWAR